MKNKTFGKVAVVTGGTSGIGKPSRSNLPRWSKVVLPPPEKEADKVGDEITKLGGEAVVRSDVAEEAEVKEGRFYGRKIRQDRHLVQQRRRSNGEPLDRPPRPNTAACSTPMFGASEFKASRNPCHAQKAVRHCQYSSSALGTSHGSSQLYTASKHAVEGIGQGSRSRVRQTKYPVLTAVAPGGVATDMVDRSAGKEGEIALTSVFFTGRAHWSAKNRGSCSLSLFRQREIHNRHVAGRGWRLHRRIKLSAAQMYVWDSMPALYCLIAIGWIIRCPLSGRYLPVKVILSHRRSDSVFLCRDPNCNGDLRGNSPEIC